MGCPISPGLLWSKVSLLWSLWVGTLVTPYYNRRLPLKRERGVLPHELKNTYPRGHRQLGVKHVGSFEEK